MKLLEIHSAQVHLAHLNVRTETHGEEDKTAIDLKCRWTTGNEALLQFHPMLRPALYSPPPADQVPVDGVEPGLPVRNFTHLGPLRWGDEVRASLAIHHGLGDHEDILLGDCTVDGFAVECLEGGSVRITFTAKCVCEDERILGRLPLLLERDVPMTVLPLGKRPRKGKGKGDAEVEEDEAGERQPSLLQ